MHALDPHKTVIGEVDQNGGYRGAHHHQAVTVSNKAVEPVRQIKWRRFNSGNLRLAVADDQQPLQRRHRQLPI
jgi:hypothetical protein